MNKKSWFAALVGVMVGLAATSVNAAQVVVSLPSSSSASEDLYTYANIPT